MSYVLVHWDESDDGWQLHNAADGTAVGGPWTEDPRRDNDHRYDMLTAMAEDIYDAGDTSTLVEAIVRITDGDYVFIRESSDTPFPWA